MLKTRKLVDGELFCWVMKDWTTNDLVIYVDRVGNTRYKPSLFPSAKRFRDFYPACKYYERLGQPGAYDISELSTEELQQFFEKEAK